MKTVFVGMSGGVDSSVAAYLLKRQGYNVVGVFIKVWQPPFLRCHWEDERLDAMRVAATLGIPFLTCDAEARYQKDVAEYFIKEYKEGRTPNPDVMCNTHVKFGAFLDFARAHGADCIATGHYARLEDTRLYAAQDASKDQSYFLWNVPKDVWNQVLFPLGKLRKNEVRKIALRAKLPTAQKRDSQGICFLGDIDIKDFLAHYLTLVPGDVLNQNGEVIGTHDGAIIYTIGQRHGFRVTTPLGHAHYVIARDIENNTITVGAEKPVFEKGTGTIRVRDINLLAPVDTETYTAVTRYHGPKLKVKVTDLNEDTLTFTPISNGEAVSSGQSLVLYAKDQLIGGGIIE